MCRLMGRPHRQFPSIHIAGTNGKGSVAHILSAVFTAAGYRTGLYTSPHYSDFRERIKTDGKMISRQSVVEFVEQYRSAFKPLRASFFEWTVAMAFHHFARQQVDIAIVETGLGGRLDSTNVLLPQLSVITNIGFDHTRFLGETLPLIAAEKAGIIKPGVPVVIGETHPETAPVFVKTAQKNGAPVSFADHHWKALPAGKKNESVFYHISLNGRLVYPRLELQHLGAFQQKNLVTALEALRIFRQSHPKWFPVFHQSLRHGLSHLRALTQMTGRWEYISHQPPVIVDSAHNEAGIRELIQCLNSLKFNRLHFVLGVVADKPPEPVFTLLPKNALYYFAKADIPRGMDAPELKAKAADFGLKGKAYTSVRRALAAARRRYRPGDVIFVGGSVFTVAEVL